MPAVTTAQSAAPWSRSELVKAVTEAIVRTVNACPRRLHHDEPATTIGSGGKLLADKM
jgi:hypothetical protein